MTTTKDTAGFTVKTLKRSPITSEPDETTFVELFETNGFFRVRIVDDFGGVFPCIASFDTFERALENFNDIKEGGFK